VGVRCFVALEVRLRGRGRRPPRQASTTSASHVFGTSASLNDDLAVAGVRYVSPSIGFATVFERVKPLEWPRARTILHSDAQVTGNFGFAVDVHDSWIAVGNPDADAIYDAN